MRITFFLSVIFFLSTKNNAQEKVKLIPFKYQNLWGLVDSTAREIIPPKYESVKIFDDFKYAEFDGKITYNLTNGEQIPSYGSYKSTVEIENGNYHLFTNNQRSILIDFKNQDSINLSLRYDYMVNEDLMDANGNVTSKIILSEPINNTGTLILINNKDLYSFKKQRFRTDELDFAEIYNGKNYNKVGLILRDKKFIRFYNHKLEEIDKKPINENDSNWDLYSSIDFNQIFGLMGVAASCYSCPSMAPGWDLDYEIRPLKPGESHQDFYIKYDTSSYVLVSKDNPDNYYNLRERYFDYDDQLKILEIKKNNSAFFYDRRYMDVKKILFPRKYLQAMNE